MDFLKKYVFVHDGGWLVSWFHGGSLDDEIKVMYPMALVARERWKFKKLLAQEDVFIEWSVFFIFFKWTYYATFFYIILSYESQWSISSIADTVLCRVIVCDLFYYEYNILWMISITGTTTKIAGARIGGSFCHDRCSGDLSAHVFRFGFSYWFPWGKSLQRAHTKSRYPQVVKLYPLE